MYERAAGQSSLGPLWHVRGPRTFFAGPLSYNASHQHGAPVFLAGLYGRFRLRIRSSDWMLCRTAMIPAGVEHELDLEGDPLAVLYVEPSAGGAHDLVPLTSDRQEVGGAVVGDGGIVLPLRELYEDASATSVVDDALEDLCAFSTRRSRRRLDERIARAIAILNDQPDRLVSAADLASSVGLSTWRFQHLFTAETGVAFRRYRGWGRMREAIGHVVSGGNLTAAAHAAGFSDQAHFAHDFRKTFGAPASRSLVRVRR